MARVLIVCQIPAEGRDLAKLLRRDGHRTSIALTPSAALQRLPAEHPDLLVLSVPDPASTLSILARPAGSLVRRTPAIAIVKEDDAEEMEKDQPGLLEILPTPFTEDVLLARVDALLRVRSVLFGPAGRVVLWGEEGYDVDPRASRSGLTRLVEGFWRLAASPRPPHPPRQRPLEPYLDTAASIVEMVEARDGFDPGHGRRVAAYCAAIAERLGLAPAVRQLLDYAAEVHDIGKIAFPSDLLRKPALTESERKLLRFHPRRGAELVSAITPYAEAANIILLHHERPDGEGYYHRRFDEVPVASRILCVADVFDGLTSHFAGTLSMTPEEAIEVLREGRGKAFDADTVDAAVDAVRPPRHVIPLSLPPELGRTQ